MNRLLATVALAAFLVAMAAIALTSFNSGGSSRPSTPTTTRTTSTESTGPTTTAPKPPKRIAIELTGAGAYDPEGDGHENDSFAPQAVDGNPATYWKTEHYTNGFFKKGVGLVLDTGRRQPVSRVVVGTDGGGSSAQIQVGDSLTGPFHAVSPSRPLTGSTTFTLTKGAAGRYIVVWITAVPSAVGEAHVTEVRATRLVPSVPAG